MNIWIISDTHFHHKKLWELEYRPKDFKDYIILGWNRTVKSTDLVIHLGDVILGQNSRLGSIMNVLTGRKVLCRGNHDKKSDVWYMERGFDFVCDYFIYKNIAFSHAPLTPLPYQGGDKYNKVVELNIHGHFHDGKHRNENIPDDYFDNDLYRENNKHGFYHLINIENTFKPVSLKSILKQKGLA